MKKIFEVFALFALLLPAVAFADIAHNYPHISLEADGNNGNVSLVPKGTGVVNYFGDVKVLTAGKGLALPTPATSGVTASGTPVATPSFTGPFVAVPTVAANGAVDMPIPTTDMLGRIYWIINSGANSIVLWPSSGVTINGTTSVTLATGTITLCILTSSTTWVCGEAAKA